MKRIGSSHMRISLRRLVCWGGAIATGAALSIGVFASTAASASPKPTGSQAKYEYCIVKVAPLQPGQSASRVLSHACSDQHAKGSDLPLGYSAAANPVVMSLYEYTDWNPDGGSVLSYSGPACSDGVQYKFKNTRFADNGLSGSASSWRAGGGCWATTLYYWRNFAQYAGSPWRYRYPQGTWEASSIDSGFDNHVWSVWTGYSR